jgi:hypothetical protein
MIGRMNPIPELVVAPSIVIASPILGMARERTKLIKTSIKVQMTFYFPVNFCSGSKNNSSTVSLQGKIVNGVANRITVKIPNKEM